MAITIHIYFISYQIILPSKTLKVRDIPVGRTSSPPSIKDVSLLQQPSFQSSLESFAASQPPTPSLSLAVSTTDVSLHVAEYTLWGFVISLDIDSLPCALWLKSFFLFSPWEPRLKACICGCTFSTEIDFICFLMTRYHIKCPPGQSKKGFPQYFSCIS